METLAAEGQYHHNFHHKSRPRRRQGGSYRMGSVSPSPSRFKEYPETERKPARRQKQRSVTLSPARRSTSNYRTRSEADWQNNTGDCLFPPNSYPSQALANYPSLSPSVHQRPSLPTFARRGKLRKTNSEPTDIFVDERDQGKVEKIQDILNSLNFAKFHVGSPSPNHTLGGNEYLSGQSSPTSPDVEEVWSTPRSSFLIPTDTRPREYRNSLGESDFIATDIEELKEAAQSIEVLSRRSRRRPSSPGDLQTSRIPSLTIPSSSVVCVSAPSSSTLPRSGGITSRIGGHPRGVMQFLPSVKSSEFLSQTAYESYMANKTRRQRINSSLLDDEETLLPPQQHISSSYTSGGDLLHSPLIINTDQYTIGDHASLRRKVSMPDRFYGLNETDLSLLSPLRSRRPETEDSGDYGRGEYSIHFPHLVNDRGVSRAKANRVGRFASFAPGMHREEANRKLSRQLSQHDKTLSDSDSSFNHSQLTGADSLAGFSRFSKLLRSLRTSPEEPLSPASSESPLSSPNLPDHQTMGLSRSWHAGKTQGTNSNVLSDSDSSFLQADLMVWRKRSKGSLRRHEDTRTHIVKEIFDTEGSYVENLQLLVNKYLRPLKRPELCTLIDSALVDEIFFQIPEILGHHELFFAALKSRLDTWDCKQKIGDIILNNFAKQSVIDTYTAFINNWKHAKHAIRIASQSKSSFAKYLERCSREHKNKLTLDALLIMPVQRIPRYELLIKELLKHTSVEHPDHQLLTRAQKEIHDLAIKINHVEQEAGLSEQMQQRLREIEAIIDGLDDLVSPDRIFYRYDLVTVLNSFFQCFCLACKKHTACKWTSPPAHNFLENHKFKLLMKVSLDDLETEKKSLPLLTKIQDEVKQLQDDLRVLGKISELTTLLQNKHNDLDSEVDNSKESIRKQLGEKHLQMTTDPLLTSLDLMITTEEGVEAVTVAFHSADKRVSWEKCFTDAKDALALSYTKRPPPTFLKPVSLHRTRAGLHFTCASATLGNNEYGYPNVWICNSDGYVGQVCILNIPEPEIISCNGITNCSIACICAVPIKHIVGGKRLRKTSSALLPISAQDEEDVLDAKLKLESESSDNEDSTEPSESKSSKSPPPSSAEAGGMSRSALDSSSLSEQDPTPTMWLGTEDGCILIFNFNDNVRTKRTSPAAQHSSSITGIMYVDDRVFVSLGSGEIVFYERDAEGCWVMDSPRSLQLPQTLSRVISSMLPVTSRLWFSSGNQVFVLNLHTLTQEHLLQVSSDSECAVTCMTTAGLGVWIAMQGSSVIKLFHILTMECLLEINVSPVVTKTLAGSDDIIRQHKVSRLRVTALLCCKDLLWVGTSAGVILTVPLLHLSHNSTRITTSPNISVCSVGHSGQCRFLAHVDLQQGMLSAYGSQSCSSSVNELNRRRMSLNVAALQQGKVFVISGGDGFEDFQDSSADDDDDDSTGRDDSTNHLLIWQV